jgi:hypothetical protein
MTCRPGTLQHVVVATNVPLLSDTELADRTDMIYAGTQVTAGRERRQARATPDPGTPRPHCPHDARAPELRP